MQYRDALRAASEAKAHQMLAALLTPGHAHCKRLHTVCVNTVRLKFYRIFAFLVIDF